MPSVLPGPSSGQGADAAFAPGALVGWLAGPTPRLRSSPPAPPPALRSPAAITLHNIHAPVRTRSSSFTCLFGARMYSPENASGRAVLGVDDPQISPTARQSHAICNGQHEWAGGDHGPVHVGAHDPGQEYAPDDGDHQHEPLNDGACHCPGISTRPGAGCGDAGDGRITEKRLPLRLIDGAIESQARGSNGVVEEQGQTRENQEQQQLPRHSAPGSALGGVLRQEPRRGLGSR